MDNNSNQAYKCDPISHTKNIKWSCSVDLYKSVAFMSTQPCRFDYHIQFKTIYK